MIKLIKKALNWIKKLFKKKKKQPIKQEVIKKKQIKKPVKSIIYKEFDELKSSQIRNRRKHKDKMLKLLKQKKFKKLSKGKY